jgi:hypothetical protein
MKAITIKNPWAHLIAAGIKDVENRTWPTKFRGPVLIHAAKVDALPAKEFSTLIGEKCFDSLSPEQFAELIHKHTTRSAIIGKVDIVGCIETSQSIWAMPGHYHWQLKNAVEKPILNIKGALSFWECDAVTLLPYEQYVFNHS